VNEALLVEQIAFFIPDAADGQNYGGLAGTSVKFDLVIGNKTVIRDCVVETAGQQAFYNDGAVGSSILTLEGVGILIPPQVEFYVRANTFGTQNRAGIIRTFGVLPFRYCCFA
jgi:hypothetical protein